ncbi:Glycosyltransferase PglI [Alteromonas sp. 38]|uniref:glycosyltransferase family 2 protein n=1 Tax=Alteromonas TaxID=226 RepID=UPI0012F34EF6|nr:MULTISPECIES: glycosyltransferase family 2 protein [Alteromonas]CAD5280451.1 Glycosyltransferase PglI [Alteromonas sp. 154]VXB80527.1 Glycosyltransferase PglI [Alteromonas sp. 38]
MSLKISVVITTYNRPDCLLEALEGVKNQICSPHEIIIIDDNSSCSYDSVMPAINSLNAKYCRQNVSCGANKARNLGVEYACGDVVAFLDDDDIWLPEYLTILSEQFRAGADACVSGFKQLGKEDVVVVNKDTSVTKSSLLRGNTYCGMSGFSAKRELLLKNTFDESLNNGQDWDMYVRLFQLGVTFVNVPNPIFLYRFQNEDGIGAKVRKMKPEQIDKRLGSAYKHKEFLGEYWFKKRVSEQFLFSLKHKNNKPSWIIYSIKKAGLIATGMFFVRAFNRKLTKRPMSI